MDPLTIFVVSIVGALASDALRQPGEFEEYYRRDLEIYRGWIPMRGRGVTWWVEPGEAVWIEAKYLRPIFGNIFSADKLGAVARAVRRGAATSSPVDFYAPYGQISLIGPGEVENSIQYAEWEPGPVLTTGDEELDRWLADPDQYVRDVASVRFLHGDKEYMASLAQEMNERLQRAVRARSGDLGGWMASVRDGNHRTFGSVLGGEERVAVRLYDNDVQRLQEDCRCGTLSDHQKALLRKMVSDTRSRSWWMEQPAFCMTVDEVLGR
jgi:hypothetical protein